jgi:hypothetical protein
MGKFFLDSHLVLLVSNFAILRKWTRIYTPSLLYESVLENMHYLFLKYLARIQHALHFWGKLLNYILNFNRFYAKYFPFIFLFAFDDFFSRNLIIWSKISNLGILVFMFYIPYSYISLSLSLSHSLFFSLILSSVINFINLVKGWTFMMFYHKFSIWILLS